MHGAVVEGEHVANLLVDHSHAHVERDVQLQFNNGMVLLCSETRDSSSNKITCRPTYIKQFY